MARDELKLGSARPEGRVSQVMACCRKVSGVACAPAVSALGRTLDQDDEDEARPEELGRVEYAPRQGEGRLAWEAHQDNRQDQ